MALSCGIVVWQLCGRVLSAVLCGCVWYRCVAAVLCGVLLCGRVVSAVWKLFGSQDTALDADQSNQTGK